MVKNKQDGIFSAYIADLVKKANNDAIVYTYFLNEKEINEAAIILKSYPSLNYYFFGGHDNSERKILGINIQQNVNFPIKFIMIKTSEKNPKLLKHTDFLGSLMALGIKREVIGDIIINQDCTYVAVIDTMINFLLQNIEKIGSENVKVFECTNENFQKYEQQYEEFNIIIPSNRLDCYISKILNISREKSVELILSGKVFINYNEIKNTSKKLFENDILIIRQHGKYLFASEEGHTKKDRIKILIKKFK